MTTSVSVGDCVAPGGSAAGLGDKGPDVPPLPPGAGDAYDSGAALGAAVAKRFAAEVRAADEAA